MSKNVVTISPDIATFEQVIDYLLELKKLRANNRLKDVVRVNWREGKPLELEWIANGSIPFMSVQLCVTCGRPVSDHGAFMQCPG